LILELLVYAVEKIFAFLFLFFFICSLYLFILHAKSRLDGLNQFEVKAEFFCSKSIFIFGFYFFAVAIYMPLHESAPLFVRMLYLVSVIPAIPYPFFKLSEGFLSEESKHKSRKLYQRNLKLKKPGLRKQLSCANLYKIMSHAIGYTILFFFLFSAIVFLGPLHPDPISASSPQWDLVQQFIPRLWLPIWLAPVFGGGLAFAMGLGNSIYTKFLTAFIGAFFFAFPVFLILSLYQYLYFENSFEDFKGLLRRQLFVSLFVAYISPLIAAGMKKDKSRNKRERS